MIVNPNDPPPPFVGDEVVQDIILTPGTHLTISDRYLNIKTGCKFVVLRGASLTVDRSTLTNYCDGQKWQGIVVWGNAATQHNPLQPNLSDAGVATIKNLSIIQNARTALEPQRWWSDSRNDAFFANYPGLIPSYWGGLITGDNSFFLDNRKSADIGTYGLNNLSSFTQCRFISSNTDPGNGTGAEGVNIWNTNRVTFTDCTFNSVPARGITTIDAAVKVTKCRFMNNYTGIQASSAATYTQSTLIGTSLPDDRNYFTNNKFGISADGINRLFVQHNEFTTNKLSGFRTSSYANFLAYFNTFTGNDKGITLMNTGPADQQIFCNVHYGDRWGIFASANCKGATFRKNIYEDNLSADVLLQSAGGTPGRLPDQISSNFQDLSPFNYFSVNNSDNNIVTEAPTLYFRYFPPFPSMVPIPAQIPRTLPTCDDDDTGCSSNNNYHNNYTSGVSGCIQTAGDKPPCVDRSCLDSLNARLTWLQQQITLGQDQYKGEEEGTERSFLSDKRALVEQWFTAGNITLIEQALGAYGQIDDKRLLYGVYVRQKSLTQAAATLASLPSTTTDDVWFKGVQNIYLNYLAATTAPYVATHAQDSLLEIVGVSILPAGANARAVYYLLHGIWMEPIVVAGDRQLAEKTTLAKAATLLLIPNPANDEVTVRLPGANGTLQIFDLVGKLQRMINLNTTDTELDTATLTNGIYLLHYTAPDGSHAQARLVIQH